MIVGVLKETAPGERRVALVPSVLPSLAKLGLEVRIESGAGAAAGYPDKDYTDKGAKVMDRASVLQADILAQVNLSESGFRSGQLVVGFADPLGNPGRVKTLAASGVTSFSMELIPRITRAQSMDALSSMATVAGYKAVLLAASHLPRMFPLLMTAAGTVSPARVFVVGAGVAGLQAIATAKRLGATVQAYDVRPAVKDQVISVGGKFVELDLAASGAEDKGGYATAQGEEFYRRQRELLARVVSASDVVITTAAIPGKRSPLLITADAVRGMPAGSVIIDLAAERGGNCELTKADEEVDVSGVTILGPTNLPASVPYHASQMYARNVANFLGHLVKKDKGAEKPTLIIDAKDEITAGTLMTQGGEVVHAKIRELLAAPAAA